MSADQILSPQNEPMTHQLFEAIALNQLTTTAVVFENQSITYDELNTRSLNLASVILQQAFDQEIIGVSTTRSLEMVISVLAILKAGKTYLPLDPAYPESRLLQIKDDSKIKTCISLTNESQVFIDLGLNVIVSDKTYPSLSAPSFSQSLNGCILYTSGSTGKPKGVCLGHKGLTNFLTWQKENSLTGKGINALQFCHLSFDAAFQEIFVPLTTGGTIYLVNDDYRLDASKLLNFLTENSINRAFFPYVTLQYLTEAAQAENRFPVHLKEVITGGELLKITPSIRKFFSSIPQSILINGYGPTETTICVTELRLTGNPDDWTSIPTIGSVIAHASIVLLDENLQLTEQGQVGEISISGPGVANGYLYQPEMTAERFIDWMHPLNGKVRLYRTGDLGKQLDNGEIEFFGRKDKQVKIRGNRVELGEIEIAIAKQDNIKQAVVVLREDQPGRKTLVAYLVGNTKGSDSNKLRETIAKLLPDYMIPSAFVWMEELPKTTSGKIDRNALPKPNFKRPDLNILYKEPRTKLEEEITLLLNDIFQYDKIGIDDNFFELGGNSLLAQKTVAELKYQYNYHLPITKFYQYPTAADIAAFLEGDKTNKPFHKKRASKATSQTQDIAIIGMSGRFPGANTIDELWTLLKEGKEAIDFFTGDEIDIAVSDTLKNHPNYVKARGIIKGVEDFDAHFFGISPKVAELMDPQQRVFLEIAWEALERSGYTVQNDDCAIGVFAGCGSNTYYTHNVISNIEKIATVSAFQVATVNDKDYISSRVAYSLDLKGPAITIQSACSTSLLAIAQATESIRNGRCDMALAGGVAISSPINNGHLYEEGFMLSKDGHTRTFDADATGTVFSDGAGVVLLKSREQAEHDGDLIFAVIKGIGFSNDGGGKGSFTAPSSIGQATAVDMAISDAGIDPSTISYIETQGTATLLGDSIEIEGLNIAFGEEQKKQFCTIGSIKSNIGHLTAAAGVTGLIKTALSLHYKQIPASINYKKPNPHIDFPNSPFIVNQSLKKWEAESIRRAGVSSFGVGGTNVHVILEEAETRQQLTNPGRPVHLINWSAKTEASLANYREKLSDCLADNGTLNLADAAYTFQNFRQDFNYREFAVAANPAELLQKITSPSLLALNTKKIKESIQEVIFIFSGQGSVYLNMCRDLYNYEQVFRSAAEECAMLFEKDLGERITSIIYPTETNAAAEEKIKEEYYNQPALFTIGYSLAKLWMSWGIQPAVLIGEGPGEFLAAHFAGIFSLQDAIKIIVTRSRLTNELPKEISLNPPSTPIVSMVTGQFLTNEEATDPLYWTNDLRSSLLFADAVKILLEGKGRAFLEIGTGNVNAALIRQQAEDKAVLAVSSFEQGERSEYYSILNALGQLWLNGIKPDWSGFNNEKRQKLYILPTYAFNKKRYWVNPVLSQSSAKPLNSIVPAEPINGNIKERPTKPGMGEQISDRLKDLFENISGIEMQDVIPDMNFTEIGFDSLLLTQASILLKKEFNVPISFRQLNEQYNTLRSLATYLNDAFQRETFKAEIITSADKQHHEFNQIAPVQNNKDSLLELLNQQLHLLAKQVATLQDTIATNNIFNTSAQYTTEPSPLNGSLNDIINENDQDRNEFITPPVPNAILGKDEAGIPAWFVKDEKNSGKYLQIAIQ